MIPSCCSTAEPDIGRGLSNTIDEVMQSISRAANEEMAKVRQTLDLKARELKSEQAAEAQRQQTLRQDRAVLEQMLARLQEFNHG